MAYDGCKIKRMPQEEICTKQESPYECPNLLAGTHRRLRAKDWVAVEPWCLQARLGEY
ncbi:hypothetical protein PHLCEN_2v9598 [Hermanssonia centrifuga]|uniref:Uncharacterized protein n=1 Tax=Hermanssonia centrifuga TaxID=98765 RepID=A0A2R6NQB5_9APHY|nr:hypothetical protein PHLCEN_2v9598 [Hermanssonia centrifuga]